MEKAEIIQFYRNLANGAPLSNVMWGKGKGYLQTMARATLELIREIELNRELEKNGFEPYDMKL